MGALGLDITDFVTVGIECTLRQLLEAGFFHAGGWACVRGRDTRGTPVPSRAVPHPAVPA
jgi:hypothetical protein